MIFFMKASTSCSETEPLQSQAEHDPPAGTVMVCLAIGDGSLLPSFLRLGPGKSALKEHLKAHRCSTDLTR
jgi:hypothetical protein